MYTTVIRCRHNTAGLIFLIIGCIFLLVGCSGVYKLIGLTPEQAADQTAKDQAATQQVIEQVRVTLYDIISTAIGGAGLTLSGLLARWLGTERKMTTAIIQGVEAASDQTVKQAIQTKATAAGVEDQLHARVTALT